MTEPLVTIKAYRRTGGAVVTVERHETGHKTRHCVSLKRYSAFREWVMFGGHRWRISGGFMRSSMTAYFWDQLTE